MKRPIFVALAFLVGCSGLGNGITPSARLIPETAAARHERAKVELTLTVPRRHHGENRLGKRPSTISSATQSVGIAVDGGKAQIFNATPGSPGCSVVASG